MAVQEDRGRAGGRNLDISKSHDAESGRHCAKRKDMGPKRNNINQKDPKPIRMTRPVAVQEFRTCPVAVQESKTQTVT